ncbi:MAG: hypothetical protein WDZ83_10775 [Rhizobiaceae bacterium]
MRTIGNRTSLADSASCGALLALSTLLTVSGPAAAQDVDAFLDRFQAVMTEQGASVEWAGMEEYDNADGDPVIALKDVRVAAGGEDATIDLVELIDVSEEGDGWRIGTLYVPEYARQDGEDAIHLSEITMDGIILEPEGAENAYGGVVFYDAASLGEMTVTVKGEEVFTMEGLAIALELPDSGGPMRFSGAADAFTAKPGATDDPKSKAVFAALGYEEVAGHFVIEGDWDPAEGRASLSRYDITVDELGTFGISLEIGGYTPDFIRSMREMQASMMANPGADDSARGLAMMGLMQQLTFRSARIHFQDDTLTEKVLEFVAQQQGARSKDVANQAKAMVPFMMMQLGDQQLTAQTAMAVSAFLDNPGNLVIAAQPASPVPFALIMAGAMSAPQSLPQTLGVAITANECQPASTTC